jgi:hypothetical protein
VPGALFCHGGGNHGGPASSWPGNAASRPMHKEWPQEPHPERFRASWRVQLLYVLVERFRSIWRWVELRRQRSQREKTYSEARQCRPTPADGSEDQPMLSLRSQVEDGPPFSTPSTAPLDYLVKEQQLAGLKPTARAGPKLQGARPDDLAIAARARRRGDRMSASS